jgi:adenylosuccinate lyase
MPSTACLFINAKNLSWNAEKSFKQLLSSDPDIQKHLDKKELEEIFSLNYHLKYVEEIFARVFQQ